MAYVPVGVDYSHRDVILYAVLMQDRKPLASEPEAGDPAGAHSLVCSCVIAFRVFAVAPKGMKMGVQSPPRDCLTEAQHH